MKLFEIINGFQLLTVFAKISILDVWQGFEYASDSCSYFTTAEILLAANNENERFYWQPLKSTTSKRILKSMSEQCTFWLPFKLSCNGVIVIGSYHVNGVSAVPEASHCFENGLCSFRSMGYSWRILLLQAGL